MSDTGSLSAQFLVTEGTDRKCYHHPDDPNSCIKVLHQERRASRFWREVRYFSSLWRRDVEFKYLAANLLSDAKG